MRWMSKACALAALFGLAYASDTFAQRRTVAGVQRQTGLARRDVKPPLQQPTATTAGPDWSIMAGFASGDDEYDLGIAVGANARWRRSDWPVAVRGDAYFAHHSGDFGAGVFGDFDVSLNLFGVMGSAEYDFPTETKIKPYVFGGLGIFYANVDVEFDNDMGEEIDGYDSETDLGFAVGGGARFTPRFGVELRLMDAGGFTTIPILAVLYF